MKKTDRFVYNCMDYAGFLIIHVFSRVCPGGGTFPLLIAEGIRVIVIEECRERERRTCHLASEVVKPWWRETLETISGKYHLLRPHPCSAADLVLARSIRIDK